MAIVNYNDHYVHSIPDWCRTEASLRGWVINAAGFDFIQRCVSRLEVDSNVNNNNGMVASEIVDILLVTAVDISALNASLAELQEQLDELKRKQEIA